MSAKETEILNSSTQLQHDLLTAVRKGDNTEIEHLIINGADVHTVDDNGNSLLHWAAADGQIETIVHLVSTHKMDINAVDIHGNSILHSAAYNGQLGTVSVLLSKHQMDFNLRNNRGENVLHAAAQGNKVDVIKLLVSKGIDVNAITHDGSIAWHLAAWNGGIQTLDYFRLVHNVDVEARTKDGRTALYLSVQNKQSKATAHLLKLYNANIYAENTNCDTPLKLMLRLQNDGIPSHKPKLQQALIDAVCAGDSALIDRLILRGADIKVKDVEGNTLLHWAVAKGHLEILKMLQERGLDIKATANNGCTLLHSAASNGQNEIMQYLLTTGIDVNVKTNDGYTPLHFAAWSGQVDAIKLLMRCGAEFGAKDSSGKTALDLASEQNHDAARDYLALALQRIADLKAAVLRFDNSEIDRLVAEGAYIHAKDDDTGSTLLHWAASVRENAAGQVETMRQLVTKYKVDIQARDNGGNTVLHTAAVNCRKAAMAYLVVECDMNINSVGANGYTPLHLAAWMGHIDSVTFLVQKAANVYAKAQDGRTAQELAFEHNIVRDYLASTAQQKLLNAVYKGDIAEIKSLIAQGAEIPIQAIHTAAQYNQVATIEYFLSECNMAVDSRNSQNETPLHVAACWGCQEALTCLLSHKADLSNTDNNGFTPLHWAVLKKHSTVILSLVDAGANINAKTNVGETPLHMAACHGIKEAVEHLLKTEKKDINLIDHQGGYTALHWAAMNGHEEIIGILLTHGADPNIKDSQGRTYKELLSLHKQEVPSSSSNPLHSAGYFAVSRTSPQAQSETVSDDKVSDDKVKSFAPAPNSNGRGH